ncbi:MAG: cell division protein ZapA [Lachnospiraceae bacterium]|nr:cell division protein ZapA [Lachnospiraceae bacterium]
MAEKRVIKVLIAGKVMTMSGYESEEYMQKVAAYINSKIEEYEKADAFRRASADIRHRMLELNFADSYFKEKEHAEDLEQRLKDKINELDEMKHNYVNSQVMVDDQKKDVGSLEAKLRESEKSITRLQTTLTEREKTIADLQAALKEAGRDPRTMEPVIKKEPEYVQTSIEDLLGVNKAEKTETEDKKKDEENAADNEAAELKKKQDETALRLAKQSEAFRNSRNGKRRR